MTNFLCTKCGACWHGEVAGVRRVDLKTCPGCPARDLCVPQAEAVGWELGNEDAAEAYVTEGTRPGRD